MGLDLTDLRRPRQPLPEGVELAPGEIGVIGSINDHAYGIEASAWGAAMEHEPDLPLDSLMAIVDGEPVACAIVLDHHGDAASPRSRPFPSIAAKGLAGWIITELLDLGPRPRPDDGEPAGEQGGRTGLRAAWLRRCRIHRDVGAARGVMPDSPVWI